MGIVALIVTLLALILAIILFALAFSVGTDSIPGPQGAPGTTGSTGKNGDVGEQGPMGQQGKPGDPAMNPPLLSWQTGTFTIPQNMEEIPQQTYRCSFLTPSPVPETIFNSLIANVQDESYTWNFSIANVDTQGFTITLSRTDGDSFSWQTMPILTYFAFASQRQPVSVVQRSFSELGRMSSSLSEKFVKNYWQREVSKYTPS